MLEDSRRYSSEECLHPEIQEQLEQLNRASGNVNKYEVDVEQAKLQFRRFMADSTLSLEELAEKLGSNCIDKSRPYYETRMLAREAQLASQLAVERYNRACDTIAAARDTIAIAEKQSESGCPVAMDSAWQEMLNHANARLFSAERERQSSANDHEHMTTVFNKADGIARQLEKELHRFIKKSKPYFDLMAKFNNQMRDERHRIAELEERLAAEKSVYAGALRQLEAISNAIHERRKQATKDVGLGQRSCGVGAEQVDSLEDDEERADQVFDTWGPIGLREEGRAKPSAEAARSWRGFSQSLDSGALHALLHSSLSLTLPALAACDLRSTSTDAAAPQSATPRSSDLPDSTRRRRLSSSDQRSSAAQRRQAEAQLGINRALFLRPPSLSPRPSEPNGADATESCDGPTKSISSTGAAISETAGVTESDPVVDAKSALLTAAPSSANSRHWQFKRGFGGSLELVAADCLIMTSRPSRGRVRRHSHYLTRRASNVATSPSATAPSNGGDGCDAPVTPETARQLADATTSTGATSAPPDVDVDSHSTLCEVPVPAESEGPSSSGDSGDDDTGASELSVQVNDVQIDSLIEVSRMVHDPGLLHTLSVGMEADELQGACPAEPEPPDMSDSDASLWETFEEREGMGEAKAVATAPSADPSPLEAVSPSELLLDILCDTEVAAVMAADADGLAVPADALEPRASSPLAASPPPPPLTLLDTLH